MKIKLFGKKIDPACEHCKFGRKNADGDKVFCQKKGIVNSYDSCRAYKYDPLKRSPKKIKLQSDLSEKDFQI